jgi:isochorismate synthase EntC
VIDGIKGTLESHCSRIEIPAAPKVKKVNQIEHLHTPIVAILNTGESAISLGRQLHPTPAVAGFPKGASIEWLRENEKFSRGWYAGAIGMRGSNELCLAVAIRCALVRNLEVSIFAGCGIVKGSDAQMELIETDRKAESVLNALRGTV